MKYYYQKPNEWVGAGETYVCDHPLYNRCTLFQNGSKGIAIIQEHFNEKTKARWWGTVEPWLASDIYFNPNFSEIFKRIAREKDINGLFPTISVRSIMWLLRIKPLKREYWEDPFKN